MTNVQVAHVLRGRATAIREADPLQRPIFAHRGSPTIGSGEDWTYARCQDFLGSSCYPAWNGPQAWDDSHAGPGQRLDRRTALDYEMWHNIALRYDTVRSCNVVGRPIWAAEFQGGAGEHPASTRGGFPSAEDIRRWMLTTVGTGVTAISFWVTRAEIQAAEANGFSLLDSAGETTPRFEEAARIGRALNRHAGLFAQPTWGGAEIAILVNEGNYQHTQAMVQGGGHLTYSLRGWHRLLWELSIPVDFVELSYATAEELAHYKALILPFPLSLAEKLAVKLAAYVEGGGNLISEACAGRIDEHTYCRRGELSPTMAALCGVRHTGLQMVREPNGAARWSPPERTWSEYREATMLTGVGPLAGHEVQANVYVETFECVEGEPCLRDGQDVAGVVRTTGWGRAWLLGTFLGHEGTAHRDGASQSFIRALLAQCGIASDVAGRLLRRRRVAGRQEAWLLTNPTAEPLTETLDVAGWSSVSDLLDEPITRAGDRLTLDGAGSGCARAGAGELSCGLRVAHSAALGEPNAQHATRNKEPTHELTRTTAHRDPGPRTQSRAPALRVFRRRAAPRTLLDPRGARATLLVHAAAGAYPHPAPTLECGGRFRAGAALAQPGAG